MKAREYLAQIGKEMVESDNRGTACPIWVYKKTLRFFFSEKQADEFCKVNDIEPTEIYVASAHDNSHIQFFQFLCLKEADVLGHKQAFNAYFSPINLFVRSIE